jgi:hypothetical protein
MSSSSTNQIKKKRKLQQQQEQEQLEGEETAYIGDKEIDLIIRKGRERLKHEIHKSDEKLTKTKKEIVKEIAAEMEQKGYPVNQICDRLTKSYKGLVSDRTVQEALDAKYKNAEQSRVGKMGGIQEGRNVLAQQQQVKQKDVKDITLEDIKRLDKTKARQVAKHQISKALWWEQQAKQKEEKIKELTEQLKENDYIIEGLLQLLNAVPRDCRRGYAETSGAKTKTKQVIFLLNYSKKIISPQLMQ